MREAWVVDAEQHGPACTEAALAARSSDRVDEVAHGVAGIGWVQPKNRVTLLSYGVWPVTGEPFDLTPDFAFAIAMPILLLRHPHGPRLHPPPT